jgi:alanyl-tRNA synthetase
MSREIEWNVDMEGFSKRLEVQKNRSRQDATVETDDWVVLAPDENSEFLGYDKEETEVHITRYRKVLAKGKEVFQLVFDKTPFYAESGGQIGDTGVIQSADESIEIIDTRKEHNLSVHLVERIPADPKALFQARVSTQRRGQIANNHSATHLLHFAMRTILGSHVEQKGSFVGPDYLRFDFSHFQKLTNEEIDRIEAMVNRLIRENALLDEKRSIPISEAQKMGALAFFGEKYGDNVRVIRFGNSVELCGGTHVKATGHIGMFRIISESAIASGIRRIEAITAGKVEELMNDQSTLIEDLKVLVKNPGDPLKAVQQLMEQNSELRKQLESLNNEKAGHLKKELLAKADKINGINYISAITDLDAAAIKDMAFDLRNSLENLFLVIGSESDGKAGLAVMVSDNLIVERKLNAGQIVRELAKNIQGGGGGQANFATAGGKNSSGLKDALDQARKFILSLPG